MELLRLGSLTGVVEISIPNRETESDQIFTEGKRVAKYHLKIERNRKLRSKFFEGKHPPFSCEVCMKQVNRRYPWVTNLLHVHHVLPLATPIKTTERGTRLNDLVAVCPNCHNAVHNFYRKWLTENRKEDFSDDAEAKRVFEEVKRAYREI